MARTGRRYTGAYSMRFNRRQHRFDTAASTQTDPPAAAPERLGRVPYPRLPCLSIRNESLPGIIINDTAVAAISILLISNHNSFRVSFDEIAFVYFI